MDLTSLVKNLMDVPIVSVTQEKYGHLVSDGNENLLTLAVTSLSLWGFVRTSGAYTLDFHHRCSCQYLTWIKEFVTCRL